MKIYINWCWVLLFSSFLCIMVLGSMYAQTQLVAADTLEDEQSNDQDDMCIWIHPDPTMSTVISSDKGAKKIFVYDLQGNTVQTVSVPGKPGNIDVRYNFSLSGQKVDFISYCDRDNNEMVIYTIDRTTRLISLAGAFPALGDVYGIALYQSHIDSSHYVIVSSEGGDGELRQWKLVDNGNGTIGGIHERSWINGPGGLTEGVVADDETGKLYAAVEDGGIYKYDAEPTEADPAEEFILPVGIDGLTADVEGIAIYYAAGGAGYLVASSQGNSTFKVYDRQPPHNLITTFTIQSASSTDGIDITNVNLGGEYLKGMFVAHNGGSRLLGCDIGDIGIAVDTEYWNPRTPGASSDVLNTSHTVVPGWNMVGLPVEMENQHYQSVYPNSSVNTFFSYDGTYVMADSFKVGTGYWLSFSAGETVPMSGAPMYIDTLDLIAGWNMISGISEDVALLDVSDPGGIIDPGTLFGFSNTYVPEDTIEAGKGYWINSTAAGQIILQGGGTKGVLIDKREAGIPPLPEISTLQDVEGLLQMHVTDASGIGQTLYYDTNKDGRISELSGKLPPISPAGTFDVRFAGDRLIAAEDDITIYLQTTAYPVTIRLVGARDDEWKSISISGMIGQQEAARFDWRSDGEKQIPEIIITDSRIKTLHLSKISAAIPEQFQVAQNYPNPFNPTTTIKYDLPATGDVSVGIYNSIGQKVRTLFTGKQDSGYYELTWDATNDRGLKVVSGIYFYEVAFDRKQFVKKMILLK